jgi:glucokinase
LRRYRAEGFADFAAVVARYLADTGAKPASAVIAAAGPRVEDEVRLTNLPWIISGAHIASAFGFVRVALINDFAAMALAIPLLRAADLRALGEPMPAVVRASGAQTFAILGPGTGLGVGALLVRDGRPLALETEGGHASFAPGDVEEIEILRRLAARFGRVSNERLFCGSGLVNLHRALSEIGGMPIVETTTPEEITRRAESDSLCRRTVERFCAMLGALAGDLVLTYGAWDGAYLVGGIAPELERWLGAGEFRRRFEDKGRFSNAMSRVPTSLVLHSDAGLLGAAARALIEAGWRVSSGAYARPR